MLQILERVSLALFLVIALQVEAYAQEQSLEDVLEKIGQLRSLEIPVEEYQKLKEFRGEGDPAQMRQRLEMARQELEELKTREAELRDEIDQITEKVEETSVQLKANATAFGEILGQFRLAAGKVEWRIRSSLSSFEYPGRADALRDLSTSRMLPTGADLMTLPKAIIQEMKAQGEVKRFTAEVVHAGTDGRIRAEELIRVGVFQAATVERSEFVIIQKIGKQDDALRMLLTFPGQNEDMRAAMADLAHSESGEIVRVPIDPTRGRMFIEQVFGPRD